MGKDKFYSIRHLIQLHPDAHYYVVYGQRSNGKTYSTFDYCLEDYFKSGHQFAYIRRWKEDIKQSKMNQLFSGLIRDGKIKKYSKGKYEDVLYYGRAFYLIGYQEITKEDGTTERKRILSEKPFCYVYILTEEEHDKGFESPEIFNIVFDEFIARGRYLPDEFIVFQNVLSTIIRLRDNIKIFMLGNTINRYSIYFNEMGLSNIQKQKIGTIDVYNYGESGLKVVVEYSDIEAKKKRSDVYFAFDNPKLQMITRGNWEIAIYPHLYPDMKYKPKDIKYLYFIEFDDILLQCDIVVLKESKMLFTFIHLKTTPIQEDNKYLVYTLNPNAKINYRRNLFVAFTPIEKLIIDMFKKDKVFYQNNEIGDVVRNYLNVCRPNNIR